MSEFSKLSRIIGGYWVDETNKICNTQWYIAMSMVIFKCSHNFTCYLTDVGNINGELRVKHQEYMELKKQYANKNS